MNNVLLIGNPNVGKTTLFNSFTKSNEHTGNFHGVTVDEKHKIVNFEGKDYDFVDLPGIYSLNCYSFEEEVSKKQILKNNSTNIVIADANSLRRNLYLCLQLNELGIGYTLLINNYKYFEKQGNKLNLKKLQKHFCNVKIVDAKHEKLKQEFLIKSSVNANTSHLKEFLNQVCNALSINEKSAVYAINGVYDNLTQQQIEYIQNLMPKVVEARYKKIDEILKECLALKANYNYGKSKIDKFVLHPAVMTICFLLVFFLSIYLIFFYLGPLISKLLINVLNFCLINPVNNFLTFKVKNGWLCEFFSSGVFSAFSTVLTFLPQVCLLFMFLTILEDSGLIARMAYVFDDFLSIFGLNGKAVYIMLMGLGCNTMSAMASRNMNEKNLKIKTAILNPYISCMARLPIFVVVASAFFGKMAYFLISGLYIMGLFVALILGAVLNKTILKNKQTGLLLEFPPIKNIDLSHTLCSVKVNAVDFLKRVFTIVLMVGIIVWLGTHTQFNLKYTQNISNSVLFVLADKISFIFAPIGLNNAGVICALFVGVLAKELIVSIFTISNGVSTLPALMLSLTTCGSAICFNTASAVSFLIFCLLYSPCVSTLAIIKKEAGKFWMWFSLLSQFTIAYLFSFIAYTAINNGVWLAFVALIALFLIVFSLVFIFNKIKNKKCVGCNRCKK